MRDRYFDNAATTPVDPRVLTEMLPFLEDGFGNSQSLHHWGRRAAAAVDLARERVATLLNAEDPQQVVFTSGATEANNWVLQASPGGWISPFEHSAVREPALALGYQTIRNAGLELESTLGPGLIIVMSVNNEIGTRWDVRELIGAGQLAHSDITQSLGKERVTVDGLDFASFSGHKLYGPKGVGGLYADDLPPDPILRGGEQEGGFRAGTTNVAAIVGFGMAAAIADQELQADYAHAESLRAVVLDGLRSVSDWQVNGGPNPLPHILSLSFAGLEGETLVIETDQAGFGMSSGAACSSRSTEPSHVLVALGLPEAYRRGTVRISFGRFNTVAAATSLAQSLVRSVEKLRTMT